MNPAQWQLAFGADRLVYLRADDDQLPPRARRFLTEFGFPAVVIFEEQDGFEISFSPVARPVVAYNTLVRWGDIPDPELNAAWADQLVIGEEEFCNGHASYCVHRTSGVVSRLDMELASPECFVNSGVREFGESLLAAIRWSDERRELDAVPEDLVSSLAGRIEAIDPPAFSDEEHYWPNLIAVADDNHHGFWDVSCDPQKSKPRF